MEIKPITMEEQIRVLEERIEEQDKILKLFEYSDKRKYRFEKVKHLPENFGLSVDQGMEITKYVKSLLFRLDGDILKCFEAIETAPVPLREKIFAVFLVVSYTAPQPQSPTPDFLKHLFGMK